MCVSAIFEETNLKRKPMKLYAFVTSVTASMQMCAGHA